MVVPEVNSSKLNKTIMTQLVKVYRNTDLGMKLPVYDGRRGLYTAGRLPFMSKEFAVTIEDDIEWIGITKYVFIFFLFFLFCLKSASAPSAFVVY